MKKILLTTLLALLVMTLAAGSCLAESTLDSQPSCLTAPYDYEYADETRHITINRFSENGINYLVADIRVTDAHALQAGFSGSGRNKVSEIATASNAILAINGDDYGTHKYGTIIRNGELLRTHDTTRNMLIVDQNGDMTVRVDRSGEKPKQLGDDLIAQGVWQTFEFGPELVRNGQKVGFSKTFDVISTKDTRREPRTAIGQIGPLHYIIIVADGRQDASKGMTLPELQDLFISYGTQTAMNLDGGGSTEMWFMGQIINTPSGGERSVSDIIFF